jgi:hypothetical protein
MEEKVVSFEAARSAAIAIQSKYAQSTKRRECPPLFLIFNFRKAPVEASGPFRIPLPHAIRGFPMKSGLIFVKGEAGPWNELFSKTALNLTAVSMSMLKKKYTHQKAQDELFKSAEYFFCEQSARPLLPHLLKAEFFSRNRQPITVSLPSDPEQIINELRSALESSELYIKRESRVLMRCGAFDLSFDHLAENIVAAVTEGMKYIPKAKARVSSLALMTSGIELPPFWEKHPAQKTLTKDQIKASE